MQKRLGILTSGGDCPGLNAVIRAVVNHATLTYNWQVVGIPYATRGLLEKKAIPLSIHGLDLRGIDPLLNMGGTILGSINKGDTLAHVDEIVAGYHALELAALIGIGGDGSLAILNELQSKGNWQFIAIPKTIDNDVGKTERVVGFDTAVNTIVDALNRLTFTAASHDRVMIVEVMGRKAGHLALHSGIAGGADVILIPEIPYTIKGVCEHLAELRDRWGRRFAIVVVAEGAQMLGWRGASRYYDERYREGFALECLAMKNVRDRMGLTNVILMVPFCRTPEEGRRVLSEMAKHDLVRGENSLQVYVMCELPSNVQLADEFCEIFDGFSIGSNDLTQLILGVDKDSELVAHLFDERNEAVKRMIAKAIATVKKHGRKIGICGQAPSDYPEFAQFLVEQGIDSISLNPDSVLKTLLEIASTESQEGRRKISATIQRTSYLSRVRLAEPLNKHSQPETGNECFYFIGCSLY